MEHQESQLEIAKRLVAALESLTVKFPRNVQGAKGFLTKRLASASRSQLVIALLLGIALLVQVYLRVVSLPARSEMSHG